MQSTVLVSAFAEIAREKDIDRDTLQVIVEDVFRTLIKKRYGADDPEAFEVIFNPDNGDYQIIHIRTVVEDYDLEDPVMQIEESAALEIDEDYEVDDEVAETIQIHDFGRRAVQTALQTFRQRIRDIEKENIYRDYSELMNEIVVGEIYQTRRREVLVIHNKVELVIQKEGQIYKDRYRKGDMIRAVVEDVVPADQAGSGPQVVISRTAPVFIERLFELEVPEIYDGIVEIKKVVRMPGDRAKVAVVSHDDRVDPVGACVGVKGSRIHAVVRELGNENIDVIPWTNDKMEFIKRSLAPAKPIEVELHDELDPPRARVTVPADEVSMAIGRGGQNIRLASKLTGYELDVYRDIRSDEEDVEIGEFSDVIPAEMITKLRNIGCDSAKAVLELSPDELARRTELPVETTLKIVMLMKAEFVDEEAEAKAEAEAEAKAAADALLEAGIEDAVSEEASEEEATKKVVADAKDGVVEEAVTVEDANIGEPASDETPTDDVTTGDVAAEEAVATEAVATEKATTEESALEETPTDEAASDDMAGEETASEDTAADASAPEENGVEEAGSEEPEDETTKAEGDEAPTAETEETDETEGEPAGA
ncbi:MAG: transcription termination/antitermination protein NusA [Bacteroidetes bacterium]|nr:transcription termination/antitermination protein NusA [Bacteroidota bacterium]